MGVTLEMYYLGKHKARSGGYDFLRAWGGRGRQAGKGGGGAVCDDGGCVQFPAEVLGMKPWHQASRSTATGEARAAGAIRHLQKLVRHKRASARSRPSSSLRAGVVDTKQVLTHKQHNRDPRR